MNIYIYLDDERPTPKDATHRVYTASEAIKLLQDLKGQLKDAHFSFDHDLGNDKDGTGYMVACWMEEQAFYGNWDCVPRTFNVHSANPAGARNIHKCLEQIDKYRPK